MLIGLQYIVTWSSVRFPWIRKAVTGEPALLLFRGEILADSLRQARVTEGEVRSAIRSAGLESFQEAEAVVLETDASFSVIPRQNDGAGDEMPSLSDVQRHDRSDHR